MYIAELHAVLQALRLVKDHSLKRVVICTDSRSVIQSLSIDSPSSALLTNIYNVHQELSVTGTRLRFLWVPGHKGIFGNEQADKFAKEALSICTITKIPVEYQSIKRRIRNVITKAWQAQWTNTSRATQLRRIKPQVENWSTANRKNRREEKVLSRLRLGHTVYTHSYIYSQEARPVCTSCNHPQTVEHILLQCLHYRRQRNRIVDFCNEEKLPLNIATLLGDSHPELLNLLFSFLREIKLFEKL